MRPIKRRITARPVRRRIVEQINCQLCDKPFTPGTGMRTYWACKEKQAIGSQKFRRVQRHRCKGCGHKIELSPCVICNARKEAPDATSPS